MSEGRGRILEDQDAIDEVLRSSKRVAVLGIKPESQSGAAAYYVPAYMQREGFEVVPVPVYYPDATEMLGEPVYRTVAAVPGDVDLVVVFRKPTDVLQHVDDIIASGAKAVWMQLGIRNDAAAEKLADAGIDVVQDRCAMVEHRRLA